MATETVFASTWSGRLPGVSGGAKVPGPGLKIKYGKFTVGTAEYPTGGYTAADLEGIVDFTHIECIVPCGIWLDAAGGKGYVASWDGAARTLMAHGNFDGDLAANIAGAGVEPAVWEMAANDASLDGAILWALVIGY